MSSRRKKFILYPYSIQGTLSARWYTTTDIGITFNSELNFQSYTYNTAWTCYQMIVVQSVLLLINVQNSNYLIIICWFIHLQYLLNK